MSKKEVWRGAFLLTGASIVVKILSAMYRIPYQNMVGDIGFYIYQQVYPLLGIGVTIATAGFPVVLSKLIAEKIGTGKEEEIPGLLRMSFVYLFSLGVTIFLILFFGGNTIAKMMGDARLATLIRTIAFSFLLMPGISVLRGYFQGYSKMVPTAVSQVLEQFVRVGTILFLSFLLLDRGYYDMYDIGTSAMFGSVLGAFVAVCVLIVFLKKKFPFQKTGVPTEKGRLARVLFVQGIAICFTNLVVILLQFVDSFTFVPLLMEQGWEPELAKVVKGVYGRAFPLIQLGVVTATSLSFALLPSMTAASVMGHVTEVKRYMQVLAKYSTLLAMGAAVGLFSLARPINTLLFENDYGTDTLQILALGTVFAALIITSGAILQSLGEVLAPAGFVLLGMIVKWIGNQVFVGPFQAEGLAMATVLALVVVAICNMVYLYKRKGYLFLWHIHLPQILLANGVMAVTLFVLNQVVTVDASRSGQGMFALVGVFLGGTVYIGCLLLLRVVSWQEIKKLKRKG